MFDCEQISDQWLMVHPELVSMLPCCKSIDGCDKHDWNKIADYWSRSFRELELKDVWPFEAILALSSILKMGEKTCLRVLTMRLNFQWFFNEKPRKGFYGKISQANALGPAISESRLEIFDLRFKNMSPMDASRLNFAFYPIRCPSLAVLRLSGIVGARLIRFLRDRQQRGLAPLYRLEIDTIPKLETDFFCRLSEVGIENLLLRSHEVPQLAPRRFEKLNVHAIFQRTSRSFERNQNWSFWAPRSLVKGLFTSRLSPRIPKLSLTLAGHVSYRSPEILNLHWITSLQMRLMDVSPSFLKIARDGRLARLRQFMIYNCIFPDNPRIDYTGALSELAEFLPELTLFTALRLTISETIAFLSIPKGRSSSFHSKLTHLRLSRMEPTKDLARIISGLPNLKTLDLKGGFQRPLVESEEFYDALGKSKTLEQLRVIEEERCVWSRLCNFSPEAFPALKLLVLSDTLCSSHWFELARYRPPSNPLAILILHERPCGAQLLSSTFGNPFIFAHQYLDFDFDSQWWRAYQKWRMTRVDPPLSLFELCSRAICQTDLNHGGKLELTLGLDLTQSIRNARWPLTKFRRHDFLSQ